MLIDDVYGGDFLKKEHLGGQDVPVVIEAVALEAVGDEGKRQLVLSFVGRQRRLGLNTTNAESIAALYGRETDGWIGKSITLYPDPNVMWAGKKVGGVRVRPIPPQQPIASQYAAPPPPPQIAPPPVQTQSTVDF